MQWNDSPSNCNAMFQKAAGVAFTRKTIYKMMHVD